MPNSDNRRRCRNGRCRDSDSVTVSKPDIDYLWRLVYPDMVLDKCNVMHRDWVFYRERDLWLD
jgi:hypothetical protein